MNRKVFLISFIPTYCPSCGAQNSIKKDKYSRSDFVSGCSHSCDCGVGYQFLRAESIIKASSGDMEKYHG